MVVLVAWFLVLWSSKIRVFGVSAVNLINCGARRWAQRFMFDEVGMIEFYNVFSADTRQIEVRCLMARGSPNWQVWGYYLHL